MSIRLEIVVLEDNHERRCAMQSALADRFPQYTVRFFVTAGESIAHLVDHWDQVLAVALDHDLDLIPVDPSRMIDPGSGRDVADFLAARTPRFPVIVHSTNVPAVIGMLTVLQEAGWQTERVIPDAGEEWIAREWLPALRNVIVDSVERQVAEAEAHAELAEV